MADDDATPRIVLRKEARRLKLTRYFTGKPCNRGHICERMVSTRACLICLRERSLMAIPRGRIEYHASWRQRNREHLRAYWSKYREKNRVALRKYMEEWYARSLRNRLSKQADTSHRRVKRLNGSGCYTVDDLMRLIESQNHKCVYCGMSLEKGFQVDHILPLSAGGKNVIENIQLLCRRRPGACNQKKGKLHPTEYARVRGVLL